ncbi:MAG: HD domain-containing protein, partial [Oligoflexia bacterium]|nr:HD domain-containing protein [Oligoflexia bacterium]
MSDNEIKYKPIEFEELDYDQYLPCDLFLHLGSKYVKFCNNQDIPNIARIEKLKEQGVKNLYILENDSDTWEIYTAVTEQRKREEAEGRITSYTKKTVEKCRKIATQKIEKVYSFTNPDQALSFSGDVTGNIIKDLENRPNFLDNFLLTYKDDFNLFEHAYNVATISLSMGKVLNLDDTKMYNLGIGAILHDVGKRDMGFDYNKPIGEYAKEEYELYLKHPALGAQFLRKGKTLPEEVYIIDFQHHER